MTKADDWKQAMYEHLVYMVACNKLEQAKELTDEEQAIYDKYTKLINFRWSDEDDN